jgi:hypothetical protein
MSTPTVIKEREMKVKPMDLNQHFSKVSKERAPNVLKEYYKFLRIADMGNLAGGMS